MKNYRNQNGCWNCKFVFRAIQYDGPSECYCAYKVGKRPKCGSPAMDESWDYSSNRRAKHEIDAWEHWSKCRSVANVGICDYWKEGKEAL